MYSHPSPAQSNTSLSDDDREEDDIDKSTFFVEPASPTRWLSKMHSLSLSDVDDSKPVLHSPVSRLPPEVLIHILKQLHNPRDLHTTLFVSRTWCECSVELLWHRPHFPKPPSLFQMITVICRKDQTFTYPKFVRRLNFLTLGQDLSSQLFTRLAACTRLERLSLVNCSSITDEALFTVLPCCPNLVALDLTGVVETTDRAVLALANTAHKLQGLNLGGCKLVTDEGVLAIANKCPQLRRIKLNGLEFLTDNAVSALALSCSVLLEIDLNSCERITDVSVRDLWTHSVHMREFRFSHCPELSDQGFPAPAKDIPPLPNPFPNSTSLATPQLPPLKLLHPFEHLRVLDLTACPDLTDDAIEGIITNAPRIRNLVLAKCVGLTDAAVESICKLGKNLHYLHLGHASGITDRSVTQLARACSRLRYIDLACCPLLTDLSVFELALLPKLRRIGLVRVVNLTDQAIMSLGEERHDTLERIHLSYCEQITVPAVHFLLQKLTKLTHLSLTGIPAFRDSELQEFCRPPPREFNSTQRAAFCVYSGTGVRDLRRHLESIMPAVGDDTAEEYDFEEDDQDGEMFPISFPERDEYTTGGRPVPRGRMRHERNTNSSVPHLLSTFPSSPDTYVRGSSTIPSTSPTIHTPGAFERPISEQQTHTGPLRLFNNVFTRSAHVNVHGFHSNSRSTHPHLTHSNSNSARSSQSNGVGFMNSYDPVLMQAAAAVAARNGTATPELVYAELGHGPGTNGAGPGPATLAARLEAVPIDEERTYPFSDPWRTHERPLELAGNSQRDIVASATSGARPSSPSYYGVRFPGRGNGHQSPSRSPSPANVLSRSNRELEESVHSALSGLALNDTSRWVDEGRGRRSRLSLRNTLHAAEHYATFLFNRNGSNSSHGGTTNGGGRNPR